MFTYKIANKNAFKIWLEQADKFNRIQSKQPEYDTKNIEQNQIL